MKKNIINSILGLLIIVVAFLNLSESTLILTLTVMGTVITITSLWGGVTNPGNRVFPINDTIL